METPTKTYTPGPWEWFEDGPEGMFPGPSGLRSVTTGEIVADGDAVGAAGYGWINCEDADARLIAESPEMLALLEAAADGAVRWHQISECPADISSDPCRCGFHEWREAVAQTVAKVRGD